MKSIVLLALFMPAAFAQQAPAATASSPAKDAMAPQEELPSPLTRLAVQRGILQCAARVQQMSKALGLAPQSSGMLMAPAVPVDQRLFSTVLVQPVSPSGHGLIGLDFAPNQANGCGASLQAVAYWPQACEALAEGQMAKLKKLPPLQPDVMVLDAGPASKVFLLKAGPNGCVSIKKEIVL